MRVLVLVIIMLSLVVSPAYAQEITIETSSEGSQTEIITALSIFSCSEDGSCELIGLVIVWYTAEWGNDGVRYTDAGVQHFGYDGYLWERYECLGCPDGEWANRVSVTAKGFLYSPDREKVTEYMLTCEANATIPKEFYCHHEHDDLQRYLPIVIYGE